MTHRDHRDLVLDLLRSTGDLPPLQRLVLIQYSLTDQDETGTVRRSSKELAAEVQMSPQLHSRVRRALIEAGWLEENEAARIGNVRYYRLARRGPSNVVPLRSAG
ncbi:hypothetical protein [Streptomyces albireticuli]|uniref:MarR family transcriptional regulator n=1 Tax=Streptomyces albireticuli TaxID=1940 RepID=A0A2A2D1B2_9ACTN|nr:hypothetical protein [Streptomyces albireticuli]MCD9145919.1 hypothetical protein [Streptomyces albireticuli]MCD9166089.1 hypothetical protein [Streptomyces albireticuli]MCD9196369.1 hypothetical protein [Streptomyces albireticuli]PAU45304.1 hypothetical protein CK936_30285 [Streptomyces albireticuli]